VPENSLEGWRITTMLRPRLAAIGIPADSGVKLSQRGATVKLASRVRYAIRHGAMTASGMP
jgi:hypothetical protein